MNRQVFVSLRKYENESTRIWLKGSEELLVERIQSHYTSNNHTTPFVFDISSQTTDYCSPDDKQYHQHLLRENLKKDSRLQYLINKSSNEEIFCLANCLNSTDYGEVPVTSECKIEINDDNDEYTDYVFHLAHWFLNLIVTQLKEVENKVPMFDIEKIIRLLQNPMFKTDLDIQFFTMDKVYFDILGILRMSGKLWIQTVLTSEGEVKAFKLSPKYLAHLTATTPPEKSIFAVRFPSPRGNVNMCRSWELYKLANCKEKKRSKTQSPQRPRSCTSKGISYFNTLESSMKVWRAVENKKRAENYIPDDGTLQPNCCVVGEKTGSNRTCVEKEPPLVDCSNKRNKN